jgi:hypothetical protein
MPGAQASPPSATNPFLEIVEALSNRHGQVDIRLDRFAVRLPFGGEIELTGALSVSVHLRELSDRERKAHESRQVHVLSA